MATWGKAQLLRNAARPKMLFSIRGTLAVAVLFASLFASCSSDSGPAVQREVGVQWADYPPTLQAKIDALALAKDCDALQVEFNQADATNLATQTHFGHTNFELLKYIDDKQRAANCF
jgi:hypothetical protein